MKKGFHKSICFLGARILPLDQCKNLETKGTITNFNTRGVSTNEFSSLTIKK